jgi:hypothetical protein
LDELSQKLEEAIALRQETEAKLAHAEKKIFELEQLSRSGKVGRYCSHCQFIMNMLYNINVLVDYGCL